MFPKFSRVVKVIGLHNYAAAVPANVKLACMIQSARLYGRKETVFAEYATLKELGGVTVGLDPDIKLMLKDYRRKDFRHWKVL